MGLFKQEPEHKDFQLNQQQLSHSVAGLLLVAFFIFIAGYYWGKKSALEPFTDQLESDSLADKVSYAFCSLYDVQEQEDEESIQKERDTPSTNLDTNSFELQEALSLPEMQKSEKDKKIDEHTTLYYTQLAGFGTLKAAQSCSEQLKQKGFEVELVTRESKNKRGKSIKWYQLVTKPVESEEMLFALIERVKAIRGCIAKTARYPILKTVIKKNSKDE